MNRQSVKSACPQCGTVAKRETYDIGDGPELSCANCEWCWGAEGQLLRPYTYARMVEDFGYDPMERLAQYQLGEQLAEIAERELAHADEERPRWRSRVPDPRNPSD